MNPTPSIERIEELTPYRRWDTEIAYAEKELKKFHERGEKVNKRFLDERDAFDSGKSNFNLFYSNTVILESALYAQIPKPDVRRTFHDYNDDVARVAATIIQRCLVQDLDDPRDQFNEVMKHCVQDRLIAGLAVAWLRLETDTEERVLETDPSQTYEAIVDQRVPIDYVFWKDFLWSPCRVWDERRWIARKTYLTREDLEKRFGVEKARLVPLDYTPKPITSSAGSTPVNIALKMAIVYEIWDRKARKVIWFSKGMTELLDEKDDPLNLVDFDPCPTPLLANITTSNCTPRPDYYMIQDQYSELDTVNQRISMLNKALKVVGVYDKSADGIQRMFQEGFDNDLIPVDNWAMFAEKGGIKGQLDWLPLEQIVQALNQLYLARDAIKQQIYELTGIADIVRGASKASETLGAQQLKAKFAGIRIGKLQNEVAQFASEILRIRAEIMVKHFDPQILVRKSGILQTEDAPLVGEAIALLQSEGGFDWRITVTSDQMAQADYEAEKQDRIELLSVISTYMEKATAIINARPEVAPLAVGLLKWSVSTFRGIRDIETMLDQALDTVTKQGVQPRFDPKVALAQEKARAEMARDQQKHQLEMEGRQQELQFEREEAQINLMKTIMEMRASMQQFQQQMLQDQARFFQQIQQQKISNGNED